MKLHSDRPVLITAAPSSGEKQFNQRRKKYLIMMFLRAVCIISAAATVGISGWLSAAFVAGALVLPWTAVLIANDRGPKQEVRFRRFLAPTTGGPRELQNRPADHASQRPSTPGPRPAEAPTAAAQGDTPPQPGAQEPFDPARIIDL